MKKVSIIIFIVSALLLTSACSSNTENRQSSYNSVGEQSVQTSRNETEQRSNSNSSNDSEIYDNGEKNNMKSIKISIGDKTFSAELFDNKTAEAFAEMLPLTLNMSELNGNEKYFYLEDSLPFAPSVPTQIKSGDIMLYEDNCLVVFYKSFTSQYSYTPIGNIDDPNGLAEALGNDNVYVTFTD